MAKKSQKNSKHVADLINSATLPSLSLPAQVDLPVDDPAAEFEIFGTDSLTAPAFYAGFANSPAGG